MNGAFPQHVRFAIWTRDAGCCALCAKPITGSFSINHRRPRGMGGSRDPLTKTAANGVLLCGDGVQGCHGYVTSHVSWSKWNGHTVPQGCDPSLVPLWHARYGWVLLNADATYTPVDDPNPDETAAMEAFSRLRLDAGQSTPEMVGIFALASVAGAGTGLFAAWLFAQVGVVYALTFLAAGAALSLYVIHAGRKKP